MSISSEMSFWLQGIEVDFSVAWAYKPHRQNPKYHSCLWIMVQF